MTAAEFKKCDPTTLRGEWFYGANVCGICGRSSTDVAFEPIGCDFWVCLDCLTGRYNAYIDELKEALEYYGYESQKKIAKDKGLIARQALEQKDGEN
jgi:hypothetical protein